MITGQIGGNVFVYFVLLDNAGAEITGAVNGDFSKLLTKNGNNNATITVTVSEIGGGRYAASFTPDTAGRYQLLIKHTSTGRILSEDDIEVGIDGSARAHCQLVHDGTNWRARAWLERSNRPITGGLTSATITIYDESGSQVAQITDAAADAIGHFVGTVAGALTDNVTYGVKVDVVDSLGTVTHYTSATAVSTS